MRTLISPRSRLLACFGRPSLRVRLNARQSSVPCSFGTSSMPRSASLPCCLNLFPTCINHHHPACKLCEPSATPTISLSLSLGLSLAPLFGRRNFSSCLLLFFLSLSSFHSCAIHPLTHSLTHPPLTTRVPYHQHALKHLNYSASGRTSRPSNGRGMVCATLQHSRKESGKPFTAWRQSAL
jgi:hypothetical protein